MAITLDGTLGITAPTYAGAIPSEYHVPVTGFKNRIINGGMAVWQRGTSFTNDISGTQYTLDRYLVYGSSASKFTIAQSSVAPAGFSNSALITSLAATSLGATDIYEILQRIEGFNIADLAWGTASAKTVTLSAWVQSSLTGTFGGSLLNSASNRSYPFTYSIPVANTWTQISITIVGDTTGTWATNNTSGLVVTFGLGVGTTYSGTAGVWAGANYATATGATSIVGTSGATFYITGVQLEKGSTATSFDYRPYGTELSLCQRYYEMSYDLGTVAGANSNVGAKYSSGANGGVTTSYICDGFSYKVTKRATPTITFYDLVGNINKCNREYFGVSSTTNQTTTGQAIGINQAAIYSSGTANAGSISYQWTALSEL